MSLITTMKVTIDDPQNAQIAPPINCSFGSHVWSLPSEKPRLAAKVFSIVSSILSQFNLLREGGFLSNYLGKNFDAIDKSLAPIDLVQNSFELIDKYKAKTSFGSMISHISKTFTSFRDTLKGVSLFTESENPALMGKVEIIKSSLDMTSSFADLKKAYESIPKGEIRKYGENVAKTSKGIQSLVKIIKNIATFVLGSFGIVSAFKGRKPSGGLQLGVASVAVACSVANHYISRKIEMEEAHRVHADYVLGRKAS